MYDKVKFLIASDTSVCVEFGNEISKEINDKIRAFEDMLKAFTSESDAKLSSMRADHRTKSRRR